MTESKMRDRAVALQKDLQAEIAKRTRAESEVTALRAVLQTSRPIAVAVAELLTFGTQARDAQAQLAVMIAHLRAATSLDEARAVGNSMEALFRATPVPAALAPR